jgi:DNA repair exonuclease SbcCD ATPase subunit
MRHLTKGIAALAIVAATLVAGGCNKGPAEAALKAADQALETAKPELQKYVPGELTALSDAAKEARAQFEKGNYTEALKAAQEMPAKIQAAVEAARTKKEELTAAWNQMSSSLPTLVDTMKTYLNEAVAKKKLPKGMDKAKVAAAQTDLGAITQAWGEATAAFQGGDIPKAVKTAQDVKAKAEALAGMLGPILPPPGPSPTAAPK